MFTVPLIYFLFVYIAILIFIGIFLLINLFHLVHTGTITFVSTIVTLIVGAMVIIVLASTWGYLQTINWQEPIVIWNSGGFSTTL